MMIRVKNHLENGKERETVKHHAQRTEACLSNTYQIPPTILVEAAFGFRPEPCLRKVPVMNQKELEMEN